jgi:formamidopyrimidine-DNA glycosylase
LTCFLRELPEIHGAVADLAAHLDGRTIDRFQAQSFEVMKTFDPPTSALAGEVVRLVSRQGKYLDLEVGELPGIARLGPDPLDPSFAVESFARVLAGAGRSEITGVLRSQSMIAGIGNAYADEILHAAKMSPLAPASMPPERVQRLFGPSRTFRAGAPARNDRRRPG